MELPCVRIEIGDEVKVTAVESTNTVYVCPIKEGVDEEKLAFLESVVEAYEKGTSLFVSISWLSLYIVRS